MTKRFEPVFTITNRITAGRIERTQWVHCKIVEVGKD